MITLSSLKKSILDILGEDSTTPTYWDSTNDIEIEDLINDAFEEICVTTGQYTEPISIPLFANRRHYALTPGKGGELVYLKGLRILPEEKDLTMTDPGKLTREDYRWITRTGTPEEFFVVNGDTLRLIPYPAEAGQVLEAYGVTIPPPYSYDDEELDLQDAFLGAIVGYVCYTLFTSMRMFDKGALWFDEYIKSLGLMNKEASSLIGRSIKFKAIDDAGK
jgi:hypothetical protein